MNEKPAEMKSEFGYDLSLLRWFASLTPDQRLDELESRVAFFHSLRSKHDTELPRDSGSTESTPG